MTPSQSPLLQHLQWLFPTNHSQDHSQITTKMLIQTLQMKNPPMKAMLVLLLMIIKHSVQIPDQNLFTLKSPNRLNSFILFFTYALFICFSSFFHSPYSSQKIAVTGLWEKHELNACRNAAKDALSRMGMLIYFYFLKTILSYLLLA